QTLKKSGFAVANPSKADAPNVAGATVFGGKLTRSGILGHSCQESDSETPRPRAALHQQHLWRQHHVPAVLARDLHRRLRARTPRAWLPLKSSLCQSSRPRRRVSPIVRIGFCLL